MLQWNLGEHRSVLAQPGPCRRVAFRELADQRVRAVVSR
jgi:hypothetical protein